nr:hypothetical protein [Deltaproteobacteria bacterium]
MSMNLTIHYNRYLYLVEPSPGTPAAWQGGGVHETFDGRVLLRVEGRADLRTVPFNPEGGVRPARHRRQQLPRDDLAKIRQDQLARDEEKLTRLKTLREKRQLEASLDARR